LESGQSEVAGFTFFFAQRNYNRTAKDDQILMPARFLKHQTLTGVIFLMVYFPDPVLAIQYPFNIADLASGKFTQLTFLGVLHQKFQF
jgi:hypothetical protein